MIVARIGQWAVHSGAILSKDELGSLENLRLLHHQLEEESRQGRRRVAKALLKGRHAARRKGYEEGRAQALKDVTAAFSEYMKTWGNVDKHLKCATENAVRNALGGVATDVQLIARINQALLAARHNPVMRIHVHPSQFALVDRIITALEKKYGKSGCEAVSDSLLQHGDVRIETETGVLEVGFDRQVRAISAGLLHDLGVQRARDMDATSS